MIYLAGLYVNPNSPASWHFQLLWSSNALQSERARAYRAPSWAWAAIEGPIDINPFGISQFLDCYADARVDNFQLKLESPTNPFGKVSAASLTLHARMLPFAKCPIQPYVVNYDEDFEFGSPTDGDRCFIPSTSGLALFPDTKEDKQTIEANLLGKEATLLCLVCLWQKNDATCGLVLVSTVDGAFSRIGVFCVKTNLNGTMMFSDCQHQTVQVI